MNNKIITRDANGNILTYKNSNGYSYEFTRDVNGNELTFRKFLGYAAIALVYLVMAFLLALIIFVLSR